MKIMDVTYEDCFGRQPLPERRPGMYTCDSCGRKAEEGGVNQTPYQAEEVWYCEECDREGRESLA